VINNIENSKGIKKVWMTLFNAIKQISEVSTDELKAGIETFGYKGNVSIIVVIL
jgi:hypothetical protein